MRTLALFLLLSCGAPEVPAPSCPAMFPKRTTAHDGELCCAGDWRWCIFPDGGQVGGP